MAVFGFLLLQGTVESLEVYEGYKTMEHGFVQGHFPRYNDPKATDKATVKESLISFMNWLEFDTWE